MGEGGNEGADGGNEEDGEGLGDRAGDWLDRGRGGDCLDLLGAIPGYELRDEEGPQGEEEGFEAVWNVSIAVIGRCNVRQKIRT